MRRQSRNLAIFVSLVVCIASWNGWQAYSAPFDCADDEGHGPDPGTTECDRAIETGRDQRPQVVTAAITGPLFAGGVLLAIYFLLLPISRLPFFRDQPESEQ